MKTNLLTKCNCHCADGQISKDMGGLLQEDGRDFLFYFVGEYTLTRPLSAVHALLL